MAPKCNIQAENIIILPQTSAGTVSNFITFATLIRNKILTKQ